MKKYSICKCNIIEKLGKDEFKTLMEDVMLLRFNKYNAYILLDDVKNGHSLQQNVLELGGIKRMRGNYYYPSSYDKYVDEENGKTEIKSANFMGVCKYIKNRKNYQSR